MQTMLNEILQKCYNLELYVPAVSFDGQWSNLAVRSNTGAPLTILQLQKDVYKEAKRMSRNEIMTIIKNSNKVSVRTLNDVLEHCVCTIGVTEGNQFTGSIDMYRARNCQFLFATSLGVASMLTQKDVQKDKITETRTDELLLNEIRPDIANTLQDDILSEFVHTRLSVTPQFVEDLPEDITIALESLSEKFNTLEGLMAEFSKHELQICIRTISEKLRTDNIRFSL